MPESVMLKLNVNDGGLTASPPGVIDTRLEGVTHVNESDVLCGRGGAALRHTGNQTYRRLVNLNKGLYITCLKTEKLKISRSIVAAIREQKGRFLEKDVKTSTWFDIGDKKAIEKTSQALREGQPKLRQKMVEMGAAGVATMLDQGGSITTTTAQGGDSFVGAGGGMGGPNASLNPATNNSVCASAASGGMYCDQYGNDQFGDNNNMIMPQQQQQIMNNNMHRGGGRPPPPPPMAMSSPSMQSHHSMSAQSYASAEDALLQAGFLDRPNGRDMVGGMPLPPPPPPDTSPLTPSPMMGRHRHLRPSLDGRATVPQELGMRGSNFSVLSEFSSFEGSAHNGGNGMGMSSMVGGGDFRRSNASQLSSSGNSYMMMTGQMLPTPPGSIGARKHIDGVYDNNGPMYQQQLSMQQQLQEHQQLRQQQLRQQQHNSLQMQQNALEQQQQQLLQQQQHQEQIQQEQMQQQQRLQQQRLQLQQERLFQQQQMQQARMNNNSTAGFASDGNDPESIDRRRVFARMKYNRPASTRDPVLEDEEEDPGKDLPEEEAPKPEVERKESAIMMPPPQAHQPPQASQNSLGDGFPDIHMVESTMSLFSNLSVMSDIKSQRMLMSTRSMGVTSMSGHSVGGTGIMANAAAAPRQEGKSDATSGGGNGPAAGVVVETAKLMDRSGHRDYDMMGAGSRHSIMSGLSRISDVSGGNSIFSDLDKRISNVSTRSIAMSEISAIDIMAERDNEDDDDVDESCQEFAHDDGVVEAKPAAIKPPLDEPPSEKDYD